MDNLALAVIGCIITLTVMYWPADSVCVRVYRVVRNYWRCCYGNH